MTNKKLIILSMLLVILLAACTAQAAPTQPPAVQSTQTPYPTLTPYPTQTPYPTLTAYPTYTPYPTQTPWIIMVTPTNTATAVYTPTDPNTVLAAFKAAGLEAENTYAMTKDDYGLAPYVCSGTRFLIPSLGDDTGGRLFICQDQKDLEALKAYYTSLGKSSAAFFSWIYSRGDVLVQINGALPEETAKQYDQALQSLK